MLSLACDYRVMTDGLKRNAWISMNEVRPAFLFPLTPRQRTSAPPPRSTSAHPGHMLSLRFCARRLATRKFIVASRSSTSSFSSLCELGSTIVAFRRSGSARGGDAVRGRFAAGGLFVVSLNAHAQ